MLQEQMIETRLRAFPQRLATFFRFLPLTLSLVHVVGRAQQPRDAAPSTATATLPSALVTFYSNRMSLEGGLPEQKGAAFRGRLFSDDDQIAFMGSGQFLTISFLPGHYTFSANSWALKTPTAGAHLEMDLVAGQHYFIEAASRAFPFPSYFALKQKSCIQAIKDNTEDKPLELKHVSASASPFVVAETSFPKCP